MKKDNRASCDICYKIICKQCGWEADNTEAQEIKKGNITACPECGWSPT